MLYNKIVYYSQASFHDFKPPPPDKCDQDTFTKKITNLSICARASVQIVFRLD